MSHYDEDVDYDFLEAMGIGVKLFQPWQIGLFVEEFDGKFIWYPHIGTLMIERGKGESAKLGEWTDTEDVYNVIMKEIQK